MPHRCILQAGSILFPKWYTIQEKEIPVKHNGIQFMKRNTEEDSNGYDL